MAGIQCGKPALNVDFRRRRLTIQLQQRLGRDLLAHGNCISAQEYYNHVLYPEWNRTSKLKLADPD